MTTLHTPQNGTAASPAAERPLPCEEIRPLMIEYIQNELGEGRRDLVREHIRRCPECKAHMAELVETYGWLHDAPFAKGVLPRELSERHRDRLARALMHPVLDWLYTHHILVSLVVAIVVLGAVFLGLRHYRVWREQIDPGIPVVIGDPGE